MSHESFEATGAPDLTVVLMAYNEADSLSPVAEEIVRALELLRGSAELLIIDDGSTDGSATIADHLETLFLPVRVIHHSVNLGLGGVYRTGFTEARGRFVTFFPADGQFPATIIADFRQAAESADLVLGYLPARPGSPVGRLLSALERVLYRALFGPIPRFQGVFMVRREVLGRLPLGSRGRGWGILMEMILRIERDRYRVVSRPTPFRPRASGRSKVTNLAAIWENLCQLFAVRSLLRARSRQAG
ncbi:MAG TPA: glycosyltransferase [Gemmatimonadales bacterium]|jgi:glycosyltransferase involved in cell wall biosynthesis|nr:glycosyltransferase [Gemmatimonadales bacterium]